jgi:hypothetical protein
LVKVRHVPTSDQDWNPPNPKLQLHPKLLPDKNTNQSKVTNAEPPSSSLETSDLNLNVGYGLVVMDQIIQHVLQNGGIEHQQERVQQGNDVMKSLTTEANKLTAGVIIGQGIHSLNNPSVLGVINLRAPVISFKLHKECRRHAMK